MAVFIPANSETTWCKASSADSNTQGERNGFGFCTHKRRFPRKWWQKLEWLSTKWLLFNPSAQLKACRAPLQDASVPLNGHEVTLAFGFLASADKFQCVDARSRHASSDGRACSIFFGKENLSISINIGRSRFDLKREHVDLRRGVIIDRKSKHSLMLYVCLQNNLDEHVARSRPSGRTRKVTGKG